MRQYQFFDTSLEDIVENAFQALALDERRSAFTPTVWEKMEGNKSVSSRVPVVEEESGNIIDRICDKYGFQVCTKTVEEVIPTWISPTSHWHG